MGNKFVITYTACQSPLGNQPIQKVLELNPVAHIFSGDYVYNDSGAQYTIFNRTFNPVIYWDFVQDANPPANAHSAQLAYDRFHYHYGREGLRNYRDFWTARDAGRLLVYLQADDHDCKHNNFDHSVTQSAATWPNGQNGQIRAITTQAQVLDIWTRGIAGQAMIEAAYGDNPPRGKPNGDKPSAMAGTAAQADYPVQYFERDFDDNGVLNGPGNKCIRVLFVDSISYKNPMLDADTAGKQFWGAVQEAWIVERAQDAKAKGFGMVIVSSTKDLFNVDNNDGPWTYSTRRDALLTQLHTLDLPVVWMTGDKHVPHAALALVSNGRPYDCFCVCACPAGQGMGNLTDYVENVWYSNRNDMCVYGSIEVDPNARSVTLAIRDMWSHDILFSGTVPFGARVPTRLTSQVTPKRGPRPGPARTVLTPSASPWLYQNTSGGRQKVILRGGTVSAVEFSRDNATFDDGGNTKGEFILDHGDWLRTTYTVAPTLAVAYAVGASEGR